MHISSLPSEFGVGNFGKGSDLFLDFLAEGGFSYWQICPLGPTGYGDSPYQTFSSFSGNPYFVDLEALKEAGLLSDSELEPLGRLPKNRCDYGGLYENFPKLFSAARSRLTKDSLDYLEKRYGGVSFEDFCEGASEGLREYFLFSAFKRKFLGAPWKSWPCGDYSRAKRAKLDVETRGYLEDAKFSQWLFFIQFADFKRRANERGVKIFGDLPIFLSEDSADVWANSRLFQLDENGEPSFVAGVGPDYFSESGQLWGNPLYDWEGAKEEVFEFWRRRLESAFEMYDVLRLDHFRGFVDYWAIPAKTFDARKGEWRKGPGMDFFKYVRRHFPDKVFIAEDLGLLSEGVVELRSLLKIPAMEVLQFAFTGNSDNSYLPHNALRKNVMYTGTHDNSTSLGWYESASESERDVFRRYLRVSGKDPAWDMIYAAISSVSCLSIFPFQDVLRLGDEARMNTPGRPDRNWTWRADRSQIESATENCAPYLRSLNELFGRTLPPEKSVANGAGLELK